MSKQKRPGEFSEEFDALVYQVFANVRGKELLKFLENNMLMNAIWTPGQNHELAFFYEGRNNLVRLFRERMEVFSEGK